jgi:hypothetical protein
MCVAVSLQLLLTDLGAVSNADIAGIYADEKTLHDTQGYGTFT